MTQPNFRADQRPGGILAQQWQWFHGESVFADTAQGTTRQRIPRGRVINHLMCRLSGQLTNVEATNDIATTGRGDFFALIRELRISRGGDVIFKMDGPAIPWFQLFKLGFMPRERRRELGIGAAQPDADGLPFDVSFIIPFFATRLQLPRLAALDARVEMPDLTLEVDWDAASAVDATATAIEPTTRLDIAVATYVNPEQPKGRYMLPETRRRVETITAAEASRRVQMEGRHWLLDCLIGAVSDTVEVRTILNNLTWRSGGRAIIENFPADWWREYIQQILGIDRTPPFAAKTAGVNTVDLAEEPRYSANSLVSPDSRFEGWHYFSPALDGNPNDLFPAGDVAEHILDLNVSAPGTVNQLNLYPTLLRAGQEDV